MNVGKFRLIGTQRPLDVLNNLSVARLRGHKYGAIGQQWIEAKVLGIVEEVF